MIKKCPVRPKIPTPQVALTKPHWLTEDYNRVLMMAQAYEMVVAEYLQNPFFRAFKNTLYKGQLKKQFQTVLLKACDIADEHSVDYALYIEAQLYWFDKWFSRYPKVYEIGTRNKGRDACWRLTQYLSIKKIRGITQKPVTNKIPAERLPKHHLNAYNQKTLEQLKKAWNFSDEQVLKEFGHAGIFTKSWLQAQPSYKHLQ